MVSVDDIKKAKTKKRAVTKGGASQIRTTIAKKPRVAIRGLASVRAIATHQSSTPITEKDDDEVEVILAPTPAVPVSSPALEPPIANLIPHKVSTSVRAEAKKKGKALMTLVEPEETPQNEEYLQITANVLKSASAIRSKSLAKRMVKMILLPQNWEDRKNHLLEENIRSFSPSLITVSILLEVIF